MKSDIRVCRTHEHDRPVYTLSDTCPFCGERTENSAPAPFSPDDRVGEYRRALKRRRRS
ncbi:RNA-protein complex protein Nop10 [Halovivax cerinus]|uniref:Ribosome biogenesis protein Nop10 n=1 Tax=Halovivax cerinus TaxID=1487865 RepID=A0ABD5NJN0_9EURY|nr:RNA-protein complex protein Nop10 [Halovivax cerinus]